MENIQLLIQNNQDLQKIIAIDEGIVSGKPRFRGTRIPLSLVLEYMSLGWEIKDLKRSFPTLRVKDVTKVVNILSNL